MANAHYLPALCPHEERVLTEVPKRFAEELDAGTEYTGWLRRLVKDGEYRERRAAEFRRECVVCREEARDAVEA